MKKVEKDGLITEFPQLIIDFTMSQIVHVKNIFN